MSDKKGEALKNLMVNLGIFCILGGSVLLKGDALELFFLGLVLLAAQTFEFSNVTPAKLALSEIMLSAVVAVSSITQIILAQSFKTPQVYLLVVFLGAVLIAVEAVRKYSDL